MQKIQRKIVNIFLFNQFNISFGCQKEPSYWDSSFEYPQHMFWLRNKKNYYSKCYISIQVCLDKQKFSAYYCKFFLIHQF